MTGKGLSENGVAYAVTQAIQGFIQPNLNESLLRASCRQVADIRIDPWPLWKLTTHLKQNPRA